MKKVLIFRDKLLPYSQTFIKSQAEALKNWDYMYLTSKVTGELSIDDSRVIFIPKILKDKFVKKYLGFLYKLSYKRFIRKLNAMQFDLLHVHFGTDAIKVAEIAQDLNIPMVVTLHGFDINIPRKVWESGKKGSSKRDYPHQLLSLAAIDFGIPSEKLSVKYIGVDLTRFIPQREGIRTSNVLFVGRMVEKKGASILLKAFVNVVKEVPDARLIMVGDGDELESNKKLAQDLHLPVEFVGRKSSDEVITYLTQSRVFCLPSITAKDGDAEGLPIVILEAQSCGVPVVTSAKGGVNEGIAHGRTGLAFDEGDIATLSDCLVKILLDDALAREMSISAVKFVHEKFDLAKCTSELEALYSEVVGVS